MDEPYRWSVFSSTVDGARPGDEVTFDVSINPPSYAPEGLHTFNLDVFDDNDIAYGLNIRAEITIQCTVPPTPCDSATASPSVIWPVDHKMVPVGIETTEPATIAILAIEQNEPVDDKGDGKTSPDGQILEDGRALVRAERSGLGTEGRTYRIKFEASSGTDKCEGTVSVCVPHDRSRPCSDNGRDFIDSTAVVLNRNLRSNHKKDGNVI
ncbi:hypothetical protein IV203_028491 [Nitzschia inconspicua]|uniref:Uncharacterized protein n=1 Tax=Nitzschia inconspicua TaxID=303405 RepID=A0A9K3LSP8_9STRA|nr:hypothetical protein IV203_028491 [Nitzschia inconspicua]